MDRAIDAGELRRRRIGRAAAWTAAAAVAAAVLWALPGWLRPSVRRAAILTARVDRGPIEATIEADGTVLPARETAISSPIDARVVRILRRPGAAVRRGDPLLELDTSAVSLEAERLEDRLAQTRNQQAQARIALQASLEEIEGRLAKARLDQQILEARLDRDRRLGESGLVAAEQIREAEVAARKAAIEVETLRGAAEGARRATQAQLDGLALDLRILEREASEARHRLDLAATRAGEDGVLTWIVPEEGAAVRRGDVMARVARLDAFRVEATVSDVHAGRLREGLPARAAVAGGILEGRIAAVYPRIENGAIRFAVELDAPSDPRLRQNLRVDVFVVTGVREGALRLRRGAFARAGAAQEVFVVAGERARRRRISLGAAGRDDVEVTGGLEAGDEVIVSDMTDYLHLDEVGIR